MGCLMSVWGICHVSVCLVMHQLPCQYSENQGQPGLLQLDDVVVVPSAARRPLGLDDLVLLFGVDCVVSVQSLTSFCVPHAPSATWHIVYSRVIYSRASPAYPVWQGVLEGGFTV